MFRQTKYNDNNIIEYIFETLDETLYSPRRQPRLETLEAKVSDKWLQGQNAEMMGRWEIFSGGIIMICVQWIKTLFMSRDQGIYQGFSFSFLNLSLNCNMLIVDYCMF